MWAAPFRGLRVLDCMWRGKQAILVSSPLAVMKYSDETQGEMVCFRSQAKQDTVHHGWKLKLVGALKQLVLLCRSQKRANAGCGPGPFLHLNSIGSGQEMVLPKLGKSSYLRFTIKIIPDRHAQRPISQVTPDFVLVTTIADLSTTSHSLISYCGHNVTNCLMLLLPCSPAMMSYTL